MFINTSRIVGGFTGLVVLLAGCSGAEPSTGGSKNDDVTEKKDTSKGGSSASTGADTKEDTNGTEPEACVPEGTKGNSKGVGAFCASASDCQDGTFCPVGLAPKGATFCTTFCATDADCGENATCYAEARGKGCVPNACLQK